MLWYGFSMISRSFSKISVWNWNKRSCKHKDKLNLSLPKNVHAFFFFSKLHPIYTTVTTFTDNFVCPLTVKSPLMYTSRYGAIKVDS